MAVIEESVLVKCPVERVFTFTTEAKGWPRWHTTMPEAGQTSEGRVGIGTTFKGKTRMMGRTSDWTALLTEYASNERWGKVIKSAGIVIDDRLLFAPAEGGTKFTTVYDVKVTGFLKLLSPMVVGAMRKQLKLDLSNLKRILEAQS